ncbi:SAM-dependent methyltransferase [candidate division TA06 bacterium B3_TA06]|uniref:SAM-dependent methyltransferase n=1 Tax=candidate division TA06 bacterium B3_TA06 TaxID=2012487 RepID=A0A532VAY1_UNCT6|nr:MAG: SAM-dependent methyltransferase [candidate division TA06 bacterium B3_TA06]
MEQEHVFDRVAEVYDVETGDVGDVDFYLDLAREQGSPVLELASGTGRVSTELARAGFEVVGLEISEGMLEIARKKAHELSEDAQKLLTWVQGDMREFDLGRTFPLVIIPFRSFQHLEPRADQEACLACVAKHLEVGGRFVLSLFAPSYERLVNKRMFYSLGTKETDNGFLTRIERVTRDHVNQMINVERIYDWTDKDGNLRRKVWRFPVRYLWRFEAELLLEKAGLEVEVLYGDYERSEFRHDGEMLFIARKP